MRAVFLIIDYVPHQVFSIRTLIEKNEAQVLAFHVGRFHKNIPSDLKNFTTYQYQSIADKDQLYDKIMTFQPDIIITAGWMITTYNKICKRLKKNTNIPIVAMSDTPWYGTWKQKLNVFMSPLHVKRAFTHIWVAGIRQFEYARRLGYSHHEIIFNSLSADTNIFQKVDLEAKTNSYPKNFLYIGRYTEIKGLRNLMKAWSLIPDKNGWTFTLIGAGEMKGDLVDNGNFIVREYMPQEELCDEMQLAGCFVLPSLKEPWALVIHEAVAAGLPILCTETCGAAPHFVIDNYNGFRIKDNSIEDLKSKLQRIINMEDSILLNFGKRSRKLSYKITPEIQMASLLQIINAD